MINLTNVETFRVFLAVSFRDAFILHRFKDPGHGGNQSEGNAGMLVGLHRHDFRSPKNFRVNNLCGENKSTNILLNCFAYLSSWVTIANAASGNL